MNNKISSAEFPVVFAHRAIVVGSGAAGFAAALALHQEGCHDIAIVTEGINMGTSRNTGSDKQTYYKMTLCGDMPDSPIDMARDLYAGGCMDGDHALAEAAMSVPCFLRLAALGVPFPVNRFGEYAGYKTDHDPRCRASSAGPLTSKQMTECLEAAVNQRRIKIYDQCRIISILKKDDHAAGLLGLQTSSANDQPFVLFNCPNIIWATGGPAAIYADSVYPTGHSGSSGVPLEAGIVAKNLTEWQYGLASLAPRWNVSGSYMQVLPRFFSVDESGTEYDFLRSHFKNDSHYLSMVFQKGYAWPFDSSKAAYGSSVIDSLVYRETKQYNRRVYLDFCRNPLGQAALDVSLLSLEARDYLQQAGACFGTPIERLLHLNAPAYELYRSKGVDLKAQPLEIALCAQHHNGGLDVDLWWQTSLRGFYAAGEAAGTHGVCRPGGSALNAGQVGAMRAAQHIAARGEKQPLPCVVFHAIAAPVLEFHQALCHSILGENDNCAELTRLLQQEMSLCGAAFRSRSAIKKAITVRSGLLANWKDTLRIASAASLPDAYRLRDLLHTQYAVLSAMEDYIQAGGTSRGSALYLDEFSGLPADLTHDSSIKNDIVQLIAFQGGRVSASWRSVRPLPSEDRFFETVWRAFRDGCHIS